MYKGSSSLSHLWDSLSLSAFLRSFDQMRYFTRTPA